MISLTKSNEESSGEAPRSPRNVQPPPLPPLPNVDTTQILNSVNLDLTNARAVPTPPPRKYQPLHQSTNNNTIGDKPAVNRPTSLSQTSPPVLRATPTTAQKIPETKERDPDAWLYEESEESNDSLINQMEKTFKTQSRHDSLLMIDDIIDHCVEESASTQKKNR